MQNLILALESSCDETAAAIIQDGNLRSHVVATQHIHAPYGGVVPELAARSHQKNIIPVVTQAFKKAQISPTQLTAIAFTQGPGLLGTLLVGACFAKGLAYALKLPLVGVHHIKAHLLANFIEDPKPTFPFIGLVVSGGNTQLILVKDFLDMELLGQTQDDAVGEAFDKIAKMMELPYPGGVWIDRHAAKGDSKKFTFPTPSMPALDFSFSGIKTAFLYFLRKKVARNPHFVKQHLHDLCASIQAALIQTIVKKVVLAVQKTGIKKVVLGGGVAANSGLRKELASWGAHQGWELFVPQKAYCTDNAAMIAMSAHYQVQAKDFLHWQAPCMPRMPL